jgi:hypothetical protein
MAMVFWRMVFLSNFESAPHGSKHRSSSKYCHVHAMSMQVSKASEAARKASEAARKASEAARKASEAAHTPRYCRVLVMCMCVCVCVCVCGMCMPVTGLGFRVRV